MNVKQRHIAIVLFVAAILSGCGHHGGNQKSESSAMLFSPNGEPLNGGPLGRPTCQEAMSRWFDRIDAHHNGSVSQEEFFADAKIQFQRMDVDKNGYLLAEEIDRFRLPYEQQNAADASAQRDENSSAQQTGGQGGHHGGSRRGGNSAGNHSGGDDWGSSDQPDPVMSADTNLDFKVTFDEFMTQARTIFAGLDADHDGTLSRDEVLKTCEQKHK